MPASGTTNALLSPRSEYAAAGAEWVVADGAGSAEPVPVETAPVSQAAEAVDVVLRAVERASQRDQQAVNLKFSVGDEELAVHVALRDGEVQTTFRTDSAELRTALAQEWQAVTGGERSVKLAPATFAGDAGLPQGGGEGSARQQARDSRPGQPDAAPVLSSLHRSSTSETAAPAAPRGPQSLGISHRLLSFA